MYFPLEPLKQPNGPVGIFWDIENLNVSDQLNLFNVVMKLRRLFIEDRQLREGAFVVCCKMGTLAKKHNLQLQNANASLKLIFDDKPGVADHQIMLDLQAFAQQHKESATIVLLSGDRDFIRSISDLRFRHQQYIILIHNQQARQELVKTAIFSLALLSLLFLKI